MAIDRGAKSGTEKSPAELIDEAEKKIERVRVLYNQYFQGIEKLEPALPRAEAQRLMRDLRKLTLRSGQRFRFQNLLSRFSILEEQWSRTVRKIEEGRYRPHLFRLQLHEHGQVGPSSSRKSVASALGAFSKRAPGASPQTSESNERARDEGGNLRGALSLLKPLVGKNGAGSETLVRESGEASKGGARSAKGPDENRMKQIFDDYVAARRQTGESVTDVSLEGIRSAVLKQVPAISEKLPCDEVDFKVVIRAGKAVLKAVPVVGKGTAK
ncbi:MAG: hypothetical protein HYY84_03015 [Deltaproteobacteria bacterium]|nr:hypothetical protein [Deltaproteobacteria bacterium]